MQGSLTEGEPLPTPSQPPSGPAERLPELDGHATYEVLGLLGSGGMGAVYKARHRTMHRVVALKVLAQNLVDSPRAVDRFQREVRAAASLQHPNIVTAYDAGAAGNLHFLVMEFVEGVDLADYVKQKGPLPIGQACHFVRQAALGLQHAHASGMVHRDVKPQNLMLTAKGEVKILDFGLARLGLESENGGLTADNVMMGTADYIAPEQADDAHAVDGRADIYSLGCTLYFLLTGRPPFPQGTLLQKMLAHTISQAPAVGELRPEVPGPLREIVDRMMAKEAAKRYQTAGEVAKALAPFVKKTTGMKPPPVPGPPLPAASDGLTVNQSQVSLESSPRIEVVGRKGKPRQGGQRGRYWRRPRLIGAGMALLALAGLIVFLASRERHPPERFSPVADAPGSPEKSILDALDPAQIPAAERFPWQPKELVAVLGEHRQRHWDYVKGVAISLDGRPVASVGDDNFLRLWDAATMRELAAARGPEGTLHAAAVAIAPDGKTLATGHFYSGALQLWSWNGTALKAETLLVEKRGAVPSVAFAPVGKTLVAAVDDQVHVWDLSGVGPWPHSVRPGHKGGVHSVAFGPDGKSFVSGGEDKLVRLWDLKGVEPIERVVLPGLTKPITAVTFSPDGKTVLASAGGSNSRAWDVSGPEPKDRGEFPTVNSAGMSSLAFSRDGKRLVTATYGNLQLWDATNVPPQLISTAPSHAAATYAAAFLPDGKSVLSAGNSSVRLWDVTGGTFKESSPLVGHTASGGMVAFSPDALKLVSARGDAEVRIWELMAPGKAINVAAKRHGHVWNSVALSHDQKYVAALCSPGVIFLWDLGQTPPQEVKIPETQVLSQSFHPTRRLLALGTVDKGVYLWDLSGDVPREGAKLVGPKARIQAVAFSPDGKKLAAACDDFKVWLWDLADDPPGAPGVLAGHGNGVTAVAFSPDGRTLASGNQDGVRLWNGATGAPLDHYPNPPEHPYSVAYSLVFAKDGKSLFAAHSHGAVVQHFSATERQVLWEAPRKVKSIALSRDGRYLATANGNGTVYILRLAPGPK